MVALTIRPVVLVLGILLITLGGTMLVPALVDFVLNNADWKIFALSSLTTTSTGAFMFFATRGHSSGMKVRQAFLMTVGAWLILSAFGALPFYWSGLLPTYTDAYFESISGITTTGATVMTGLDNMPPGILLWRGILQWLGGLGIIVMAIAVLPMLQIGGMQIFKIEAFETSDKILPRAREISGFISLIFLNLTGICVLAYLFAGMDLLDAVVHAMTTVATGGFSNHDASLGYFDSALIDTIAVIFMLVGSLPFLLYVQALRGNTMPLWRDSQVRTFLVVVVILTLIATAFQEINEVRFGTAALRYAIVNVTSVITGTGYATASYDNWGTGSVVFFFFMIFIGGCAGSTSCGIKIFRFQVLYQLLKQHIAQILYPRGIFSPRFNGKTITDDTSSAVASFFFLFIATFMISALALTLTGLKPLTALSGAATAISNVGPGIGPRIGPAGNYSDLNDAAKWILSATMLVGRLELFTVLVMLSPRFWRI